MSDFINRYLAEAGQLHPSPGLALVKLRQLGTPPSSKDVDISHPTSQIKSALELLASLADKVECHSRNGTRTKREIIELIKNSWTSSLGPWIHLFLDAFTTAQAEPKTTHGIRFVDWVLLTLPCILKYGKSCDSDEYRRLRRISPNLLRLVAQTWLQVINAFHYTWFHWMVTLKLLLGEDPDAARKDAVKTARTLIGGPVGAEQAASEFLRHAIHNLPTLSRDDCLAVHGCVILICDFFNPDTPLYFPFLSKGGVRVLVNLLSATMSQAKIHSQNPDKLSAIFAIARATVTFLCPSLQGPLWVTDALDAGLVRIMFRARRFHSLGDEDTYSTGLFFSGFANALRLVELYMLYPSVRRRFLKSVTQVTTLGLEDKLYSMFSREHVREFQVAWEDCKRRARALWSYYKAVTSNWLSFCSYDRVSLVIDLQGCHSYFFCSALLPVGISREESNGYAVHPVYSKHIALSHVQDKIGSQGTVKLVRRSVKLQMITLTDPTQYPSNMDKAFFCAIIDDYVEKNAEMIFHKQSFFVQTHNERGASGPSWYENYNQGILVLEFDQIGLNDIWSPRRARIEDVVVVAADKRIKADPQYYADLTRIATTDAGNIAIVGFFPGNEGGREAAKVHPIFDIVEFPWDQMPIDSD
ncbi:hypothetical protein WG66_009289 [Moniliophthora roreri]|uniref:Uncharacterized protein n=1 Tax=Moniliophthora roreri TaxID=221103 RepID=A0A0W0G8J4_MONRR|nr:hypothetical protein WG66_009289 [Moniliophthora roreri]